ncbi:MAG: PAS domain S-box protein [Pseudomonadota bacterium]
MAEKETRPEKAEELRRRAEKIAREKAALSPEDPEGLSPEETRQTLHELRVHRIELEMQNEELRRAQEKLEASRARYFDLYDLAPVGYVTLSEQGLILEANLTAATLLGVARSALIKQPLTRFILPEDQDIYYRHRKQLFETHSAGSGQAGEPQVYELRMLRAETTPFWARLEATAAQDADGVAVCRAVVSDLTERKRAEDEMARSRARFEAIFKAISDGAIFTDPNRCIVMVNPAFTRMFGYELDEVRGRNAAFLYVNKADYEEQGIRRFHAGREAEKRPFEIRYRRKDGGLFYTESLGEQVRDAQGNVIGFLGIHRDITERKRAEKALRDSEKRFRRLFEDDLTGYLITTEDGSILECNPAFFQMLGYENKAEVLNRNAAVLYPDLSERAFILDQLRAKGKLENYETIRKRKDGSLITVIENIVPTFDEDRNLIEIKSHIYDITDRVRLMSQLQQAQKMEAIGSLAGGIAHNLNNMLSPIMVHSEMVMMDLPPDSPLQMNLKEIYKAGGRARDLVKQILTFSRQGKEERLPLRIKILIKEAMKLLRETLPTTIDIRYDDKAEQDTVLADPTQVHQILMNLCTNAAQAMEEKGGMMEVGMWNLECGMWKAE